MARRLIWLALALAPLGAAAQDIPLNSVPVGGGPGAVGWLTVGPCAVNQVLGWNASGVPVCTTTTATAGVSSLNTLTGAVTLAAGANITITPSGNTLTFAASGGSGSTPPGGTSGQVQYNNAGAFGGFAFAGDATVSISGAVGTLTIGNSAVTNAKLANMSPATVKANTTGASTAPIDTSLATFTAALPTFSTTTTAAGVVPGSNGVASSNFLSANGTWATPPGGIVPGGLTNSVQYNAGSGALGGVTVLTNGQLVIGSNTGAPQAGALGAGTGIATAVGAGTLSVSLAAAPAGTVKGNLTGGSTAPTDNTITALNAALPVFAEGASHTQGLVPDPGAVTIPPNTSGRFLREDATWAAIPAGIAQGRLTLTSGSPVMGSSVTGATTIYYTPYLGNYVSLWNGATLVMTSTGGELSQPTTDTTKSPAAVAASSLYDMFVWNDSGTIRCTRGPAWTNNTTRSLALTRVGGILTNASGITNGPGANLGTYVGTVASNASSTIDYQLGSINTGTAQQALLMVWNMYNRVDVKTAVTESTGSWTYTSTTIRPSNNSVGNRVTFVSGLAEEGIGIAFMQRGITANVAGAALYVGFFMDGTTSYDKAGVISTPAAAALQLSVGLTHSYNPQIGLHFIQAVEGSDGTNSNSFFAGNFYSLAATLRM